MPEGQEKHCFGVEPDTSFFDRSSPDLLLVSVRRDITVLLPLALIPPPRARAIYPPRLLTSKCERHLRSTLR